MYSMSSDSEWHVWCDCWIYRKIKHLCQQTTTAENHTMCCLTMLHTQENLWPSCSWHLSDECIISTLANDVHHEYSFWTACSLLYSIWITAQLLSLFQRGCMCLLTKRIVMVWSNKPLYLTQEGSFQTEKYTMLLEMIDVMWQEAILILIQKHFWGSFMFEGAEFPELFPFA